MAQLLRILASTARGQGFDHWSENKILYSVHLWQKKKEKERKKERKEKDWNLRLWGEGPQTYSCY